MIPVKYLTIVQLTFSERFGGPYVLYYAIDCIIKVLTRRVYFTALVISLAHPHINTTIPALCTVWLPEVPRYHHMYAV